MAIIKQSKERNAAAAVATVSDKIVRQEHCFFFKLL
jgi:hypothetical protein